MEALSDPTATEHPHAIRLMEMMAAMRGREDGLELASSLLMAARLVGGVEAGRGAVST